MSQSSFQFRAWFGSLVVGVFLCALGDPAYPPVVGNWSGGPARIVLLWSEGPNQEASLPHGSNSFQRIVGRNLTGLKAIENGGRVREYNQAYLNSLRKKSGSTFEVWIITSDTLQLHGRASLRTFQ